MHGTIVCIQSLPWSEILLITLQIYKRPRLFHYKYIVVICIYFHAYGHLRCKHAFLGNLSCLDSELVGFVCLFVCLLHIDEREEDVVDTGSLKPCSGLELVPRCEPSTYQPICLST